jgi:hypothetical protein
MRCPGCHLPNPTATRSALTGKDRLFGMLLFGGGLLIGVPMFYVFIWAPRYMVLGGARGWGLLSLIPTGMVFHGALFLCGVHPKDFYGWWNTFSDLARVLLIGLLLVLVLAVILLLSASGK